jgi:WXXGXW repeat (2 copies)
MAMLMVLVTAVACAGYIRPRGGVTYVRHRPPPPRVEVVVLAPGHGYVWVSGYWIWRVSEFVWVSGQWESMPPDRHRWVDGEWRHDRYGWYWVPGRWR